MGGTIMQFVIFRVALVEKANVAFAPFPVSKTPPDTRRSDLNVVPCCASIFVTSVKLVVVHWIFIVTDGLDVSLNILGFVRVTPLNVIAIYTSYGCIPGWVNE
jgi:hypothetical protein